MTIIFFYFFVPAFIFLLNACYLSAGGQVSLTSALWNSTELSRAFKFSLLNPAIVALPTAVTMALTKTQQHGFCPQNN
jgi:hypothetical protein